MAEEFLYSDLNPSIGESVDGDILYDVDAINASIENILGTRIGERWFYPEFGSYVHSILFEPMTSQTEMLLRTELIAAIKQWEPRVSVLSVRVNPQPDQKIYEVEITWKYRALDQTHNIALNLKRI
jgi:hypothetical protein